MKFPTPVQAYIVGGAVRDALLGHTPGDRDWVVVGATPQIMLDLGFRPVGKDFPVFLHPESHEEYALARTERKTAPGYRGFAFHAAPDVTLEQDLSRRDLTINAMAMDDDGQIIDPFNGQADLAVGLLRHVSPAFSEDPVRILRVARFAARFGFAVAPDTLTLMRAMTASGEVDALVAERVWQEMARALMTPRPSAFFDCLRQCGALAQIMPEVDALFGVPQRADFHPEIDTGVHVMMALDFAATRGYALPARFAVLAHDLGKALTPADVLPRHIGHELRGEKPLLALCDRLRVPAECRDLARLATLQHTKIHCTAELRPATVLKLFKQCDALRRPERFHQLLDACAADNGGRLGFDTEPYPQAQWLSAMLTAARSLDAGALAARTQDKQHLPDIIDRARIDLIADWRKANFPD
ncbi:MAG: multifunctional CCA addition/repair protein [Paludibacterium sp.]|uniref:multifunctional CCA addition/repair protein n=1 Tax=Paludibacterium sp. TaxID=1917523 RepID=UPI0025F8A759|nr:multifunctional CCA addition/repair protein [Paludibacterium sp.]MBV8047471.1 multifunctional CCA addition/repair protein [Paludibacterium sp.]MBV8646731.1 multifunctional CCA addition/repair protein [Paludibacterium sp.]